MYLQNKYTNIYYSIIDSAMSRTLLAGYTERHHIIPKSLGGTNSSDNLVVLTAKEHFICHRLLTKMTTGKHKAKMINAAWALANLKTPYQSRIKINSSTYAILRTQFSETHAQWRTGQHHSIETRAKMSVSQKGRASKLKGIPRSEETKLSISATLLGRSFTIEHKNNIKQNHVGFLGKVPTSEHRAKISATRQLTKKIICPHCSKLIDPGNYKKSHGDRCKLFLIRR